MALNIEDKKAIVAELSEMSQKALSAVVAEYKGLTVSEMTDLRFRARKQGVYLKVVRNNLAKRAVKGTEFECLTEEFKGPLLLGLSLDAPGDVAKLFKSYIKDNKKLKVKSLAMSGEIFGEDKLDDMSKLPNREEALSMLCAVLQAPIVNIARVFNDIPSRITRVVSAIGEQKKELNVN